MAKRDGHKKKKTVGEKQGTKEQWQELVRESERDRERAQAGVRQVPQRFRSKARKGLVWLEDQPR